MREWEYAERSSIYVQLFNIFTFQNLWPFNHFNGLLKDFALWSNRLFCLYVFLVVFQSAKIL